MIKDRPLENICEQIVSKNQSSQGRSYYDYSDYYRILLAFGLVYNKSQAFAWLFNLIGRKNMIKAHWIILYLFACLLAISIGQWI